MKFLILFIAVGAVLATDLEPTAKLLASKNVENNFIVENRELTIKYNIYNVGTSAAHNVLLNDESFPITDFEVVRGQLSVSWVSIPPNGNVTHVVILKPLKSGMFNFTTASLSYQPTEESDVQISFTSAPGEGGIMPEVEFARKHSPHLFEWAIFSLMCMPSILIPFLLWYKSHSKYSSESKIKKH